MRIVIATGNAHKVGEFDRLFSEAGLPVTAVSAKAVGGMPHVVEDSGTFAGNAMLKAKALRAVAGPEYWVMSDDSGLECGALGGAPGVETANYAGPAAPAEQNRAKLLAAMKDVPDGERGARFVCHLTLLGPDGEILEFAGECRGRIVRAESGTGGFGYDPLFVPDGYDRTFAELDPAIKDVVSHRARAFAALTARLASSV